MAVAETTMQLEIRQEKEFIHVKFFRVCNLNSGNTEDFKTQILAKYKPGSTVILDFKNLDYIDSAGLTVLIHIRRKISETNGHLKLVNIGDKISKLLQITRLHRIFDIYENFEVAFKSIEKKEQTGSKKKPYTIHLQVKHTPSYSWVKITQPDSLIKANTAQFRTKIREYLKRSPTVILNFDNIRNIDSSGIASLIHLKRLSREQKKKILLVYNNRVLNRLFKLYSLDDLFSQFQTDREAIATVKPVVARKKAKIPKPEPAAKAKPAIAGMDLQFSDIIFLTSFNK